MWNKTVTKLHFTIVQLNIYIHFDVCSRQYTAQIFILIMCSNTTCHCQEPLPAPFGSYGGTDSHNMTAPPAVHITNGVSSAGAHPGTAHTPADIPVLSAIPPSSPVNVKSYHDDSDEVCSSVGFTVTNNIPRVR